MPMLNDLYPTKYIKAEDLRGREYLMTIRAVIMEKVDDKTNKIAPVIYFTQGQKGLVCNKTNAYAIGSWYGENTDYWPGKQVVLFAAYVDFQGKQTLGLRIKQPTPQHQPGGFGHENSGVAHGQPLSGIGVGVGFDHTAQRQPGQVPGAGGAPQGSPVEPYGNGPQHGRDAPFAPTDAASASGGAISTGGQRNGPGDLDIDDDIPF